MSLLVHHSKRIAYLSLRQVGIKKLPSLTQMKLMPLQYTRIENCSYTILCSSVKASENVREKVMWHQNCFMSQGYQEFTSRKAPRLREKEIQKEIRSKNTVGDLLDSYLSWKDEGSLKNNVTLLNYIAKIAVRSKGKETNEVLEEERKKSRDGKESAYMKILDFISENVSSSNDYCSSNLAIVMWSLGKIQEKDHILVKVCEEEIILHGITAFNQQAICVLILTGCADLRLKHSRVYQQVEEAILTGEINLDLCENHYLSGILSSFSKVGCGSLELFEKLGDNLVQRDFTSFEDKDLGHFLHTFAIMGIFPDQLFNQMEKEILRRTPNNLSLPVLTKILQAFTLANKGSEELFTLFEQQITAQRIKDSRLHLHCLCWITWAFATRGMTQSKVFQLVAEEMSSRGLHKFKMRGLSLCLYSFVSSENLSQEHLRKLETELFSTGFEI